MNTIHQYLTLCGFAYVQGLNSYPDSNHLAVTLHCLPIIPVKNNPQELMIITCVVTDEAIIQKLQSCRNLLLAQDKPAIMEFTVKYLGTSAFYACSNPDDPEQIVNIAARLTAIHALYVNGVKQSE